MVKLYEQLNNLQASPRLAPLLGAVENDLKTLTYRLRVTLDAIDAELDQLEDTDEEREQDLLALMNTLTGIQHAVDYHISSNE